MVCAGISAQYVVLIVVTSNNPKFKPMIRYFLILMIVNQVSFVHGQSESDNVAAHILSLGVKAGFVHSTMNPHGGFNIFSLSTNGYKVGLEGDLMLPKSDHWSLFYGMVYSHVPFQNVDVEVRHSDRNVTRSASFDADLSSILQNFGLRYQWNRQRKISPLISGGIYHSLIFHKEISQRTSLTFDPPVTGYPASFYSVSKVTGVNDFGTFLGLGIRRSQNGRIPTFNVEIQWSKGFGLETHEFQFGESDSSTGRDPIYYLYESKVVNFHPNFYAIEMTVFIF